MERGSSVEEERGKKKLLVKKAEAGSSSSSSSSTAAPGQEEDEALRLKNGRRGRLRRKVREHRARLYIVRRCVHMLLCWRDDDDSAK